jgi:signal transduction histidine kinase
MNFSELLLEKTDAITEKWLLEVRKDKNITTVDNLRSSAIIDHLPDVLKALANVLVESHDSDIKTIIKASLQHGVLRAEQGFDPSEIAREYHLLKSVIFDTLEKDIERENTAKAISLIRIIDALIDEAIAQCFHSYVETRLQELEQLQSQLKLNNEELTRLIRANQDNVSFLAHELKSPLTSIIGYSDLFLRVQQQPPEVREKYTDFRHIEHVLNNGRQILRLVNNLLEISRFDAGELKIKVAPTNVCEIIENAREMMEPLARAKNLVIMVDCSKAPIEVITDSLHLQQIVTNLVSNAIRYTEAGSIEISCKQQDTKKWVLTVSDTGIGISKRDQVKIFEAYFRVNREDKSSPPDSTGLGLAIVSRLVKLLQGEIKVISEVDKGSTFEVTFPAIVSSELS